MDRDRLAAVEGAVLRSQKNMKPLGKVSIQADAACWTTFALPAISPRDHDTGK